MMTTTPVGGSRIIGSGSYLSASSSSVAVAAASPPPSPSLADEFHLQVITRRRDKFWRVGGAHLRPPSFAAAVILTNYEIFRTPYSFRVITKLVRRDSDDNFYSSFDFTFCSRILLRTRVTLTVARRCVLNWTCSVITPPFRAQRAVRTSSGSMKYEV